MSRRVLLFLALFAGAALAQSAVEAQKADAAAYNHGEHGPEYYDADHEYYGHDHEYYGHDHDDYHKGGKHGKHSKSHSKPYKLTIELVVGANPEFIPEGANIVTFLKKPAPVGLNGAFLFDLYDSAAATAKLVAKGVITGTFYEAVYNMYDVATTVKANEVVSIKFVDGDFMGSYLAATGTLAFNPGVGGTIQISDDTLVVTGGTKDLNGAAGTLQFIGGAGAFGSARALVKLTVPKHYADE